MRALLVTNPKATATTARVRDVLARALSSEVKVDVAETQHRGHAVQLGRQATEDGLDVVVALGGDGTIHEVVNGLLAHGPGGHVPALAVVPGGSANVFARALGLPVDPVEATADLLQRLRDGETRRVGLGRADERWFTFCAGLGLDAEVVQAVERRRRSGRPASPGLYVRTGLRQFYTRTDRRAGALTLEPSGARPVTGLHLAIISNTRPWTYLADRPCDLNPTASFDRGLDVLGLTRLSTAATLAAIAQGMAGRAPRGRRVRRLADLPAMTLRADRPVAFQLDGEGLGTRDEVLFSSVPGALRVVAPAS